MKAKLRAVVALAVCTALLSGALVWLSQEPEAVKPEAAAVYEVMNVNVADIAAVKVENEQEAFAVMQGPDGLEMVSSQGGSYDLLQLRAFLYAAGHISGSRRIADEAAFAAYGMNAPRATITLYLSDGSLRTCLLLAENPLDQNSYFYSSADNAVYLIGKNIAELFLRSSKDFYSHTLFSLKTREDYAKVEQVTVSYGKTGRDYTMAQTEQGFYLTAPLSQRLSRSAVYANLLDPLLALYADEVVAAGAALADYGLDQPDLQVMLIVNGQAESAVFKREADGYCLMAEAGGSTVYRLAEEPFLMLSQDYTALMDGRVLTYTSDALDELTLLKNGQTALLEFSREDGGVTVRQNGAALAQDMVTRLMSALNQLSLVGELTTDVTGESLFSFTARLHNGAEEQVEFIPVAQDVYAVSVNGAAHFATDSASLEALGQLVDDLVNR